MGHREKISARNRRSGSRNPTVNIRRQLIKPQPPTSVPLVEECGLGGHIFGLAKVAEANTYQAEALFRA
jgi:hypothetical protein